MATTDITAEFDFSIPAPERELVITRTITAPPELVWRAFTEERHVGQWWGPDGFRTTIHDMDVRPGGYWRFIMHGPDGTDWPNWIRFIELDKPHRLRYAHGGHSEQEDFHALITIEKADVGSLVILRLRCRTVAILEEKLAIGAKVGGEQHLARLEQYLVSGSAPEPSVRHDTLVLERDYAASPERVFAAWADPEARKRWSVPDGTGLEFIHTDFRTGGTDVFRCGAIGNLEWHGDAQYMEIVPDRRVISAERMSLHGVRASVNLLTAEFKPKEAGTHLLVTIQIAALDGSDMLEGFRDGWREILGKLAHEVE